MTAILLIKQMAALIREAEQAKSAFGHIATQIEGETQDKPEHVAAYARHCASRLHDALNPEEPS